MSKVKKYSRQLVVLFIAFATVLTCVFAFTPEADAGATAYKWRVSYQLDQGNDNTESCYVKLYYKTNNGTGSESSVQIEGDDITFDKDKEGWYYWTSDSSVGAPSSGGTHRGSTTITANAFPTKVEVYVKCVSGSPAYREFRIKTIKLEVMNQSGTVLATSGTADLTIASSKDEKSDSATVSIGTGSYPYVTDWAVSGISSSVKVNSDGSNTSATATISATDNYGVNWVNAPTTTGANCTVTNGSTAAPTITFANRDADYGASFTSKWSTGNSSNSSVSKTYTISNVYVPHTLTLALGGGVYSGSNPIKGKYTGETQTLANPARTAYTFSSWTKTAGNGSLSGNTFTFGNNSATVTANWTPVGYTISPVYGENSYSAVAYNIESTSITLPTPTKTGYTFNGWVVSAADGNWSVGDKVTSNPSGKYGNITVEPTWTANEYTLSFDVNKSGAQCDTASKTVTFDSAIGTLPVPTLNAYDFVGWYTAAQNGTQVTADTVYTTAGNSTVYAHWTPVVYTISFNSDGGSTESAITYTIEDSKVTLPTPTKTGYTFSHWIVEKQQGNWTAGATVNGALSSNYGNVGLKAVYTPNNYTLNLNLNKAAGAVTEPACDKSAITVTFDAAVGTLPVPTLDGYDFAGWYNAADGGTQYTAATLYTIAADSTIYAHWTPHTHSITTDANGGNEVADSTYTIIEGTIPAGGTRTGYTFSHWEVVADAGNWVAGTTYNAGDSAVGKYGDVTLKAIWTANNYTVNFNLNDTTGVGSATADKTQITVTYDSALNVNEELPVATRNGYTFEGWFTAAEGGEQITADKVHTTVDPVTYYAHWSVVTYTLTFDVNNGTEIDPVTYTIEDELTLPVAQRTGYTFTSWFYSNVTTGSWKRNTTYSADALALGTGNWGSITIKANYTVNEYTITWIIDGVSETTKHKYNTVPTHADPVKSPDAEYTYTFTGWTPSINVVSGDATYTATFKQTPRTYTIKWVADGVEVSSKTLSFGAALPTDVPAVPEKTGYTGAWETLGFTTMPAEDVTVEAVYTPIKYAIKWEVNGTVVDTDMVDYGTVPSYTGSTPVKAADAMYTYAFKGWTPALATVTGEATYVAEFTATPNEYTITWIADGVTVATDTVAYGEKITDIPTVPAVLGMVGSWDGVPVTMPAENITIYAVYVDGCLVTWYLDGTASGAYYQLGFEKGESIAFDRADPTKDADAEYSYTFIGWSETENGSLITGYPVAGDEDLTYYAVYSKTPKEYTITWVADGAEVYKETVAFGSDIENVPTLPAKTGHTGKWTGVPATMPAENVTVTAVYTPIDYTITWVIGDKSYDTTFAYGTMPSCSQSTDKASTLTTDYTFAGWDKNVSTVTGDTTYTAVYNETARKYTVTWQYEDGTVIESYTVANGAAITYIPAIADKEGHDAKYSVPDVMPTDDITIVVTYEAKSYTVIWSTPSGEIEETWKYGETPVYDTATYGVPVKEATPEKQFTFQGWTPAVSTVKSDVTYVATFTETTRKYSVVWYVDGEFHETREIAFGGIIPTLTIPEKEGYTAIWDNPYRTMPAKDLTINAVYTAKKYTVYWKVDGLTVFSASVSYGDAIPQQNVPEKPGCTGTWENVPDKMPAENVTITATYKANEYNVTWRIDGVETSGKVTYGVDFVLTFEGETVPEEVRITIDGTTLATESYIYDAANGKLTILGTAITGDLYITARAAGGKFNVIINGTNATMSNQDLVVAERNVYHTQIIPNAGYMLPDSVDIFVDGWLVVEGYTYDPLTGKLTINSEIVLGELEIAFDCPLDPNYDPSQAPDEDAPSTDNCTCSCHSESAFTKFFFKIITFLRQLFGMDQFRYCECGAAHW